MQRTTVLFPDDLIRSLRQITADRGMTVAALLGEVADEQALRCRSHPQRLGIGDSGHTDTAHRTGDERPEPCSWR
jgi:hypothetical protein